MDKNNVSQIFASRVFNDDVMQQRLPRDIYKSLRKSIDNGESILLPIANAVANAMKDWALENGATHFTHWFQPMTGITAEKHDSFISPTADGRAIMEFSGKELIKGEPDASSLPNGGLRQTFEARGYTSWDPTSYAFIKDNTLCIPTAFCSYGGQVLDSKTPLLRSMKELNKQALRILRLFGDTNTKHVSTTVGAEQEYFLIPHDLYKKRKDLFYTGRTLFGSEPPKGQDMSRHYFGAIKPAVAAYMKDLDFELWKYGVWAKTKHNEAAPSQHELAPIFTTSNIACDHNQLTMEVMKNIAHKHGLECILHEKPFFGVNGSGKHNNWSLLTDTGKNLLKPGDSPQDNAMFLLLLIALIRSTDKYQDLLRLCVAYAGNDHRLGSHEAPPAIMSMFIGDDLKEILDSIENGIKYNKRAKERINVGVDVLPLFPKDTTDRNRTSPFAFTGNKFEFRALGSSMSIAWPNIILNTIVADALSDFADELEESKDFTSDLNKLIAREYKAHKRIVFNGDGYSKQWIEEAKNRGLLNLHNTVDALPYLLSKENILLFEKHNVYQSEEIYSRYHVELENYCKAINIEAKTLISMLKQDIIVSITRYIDLLLKNASTKSSFNLSAEAEIQIASGLNNALVNIHSLCAELKVKLDNSALYTNDIQAAKIYNKEIIPIMEELRKYINYAEENTADEFWPYPRYGELMFGI